MSKKDIRIEEKIIITPSEAMEVLGIGKNRMYEDLLKRKDFPCFKIGNKYFINKDKLQQWVDKQCMG